MRISLSRVSKNISLVLITLFLCKSTTISAMQSNVDQILITEYDQKKHSDGVGAILSQSIEIDKKMYSYEFLVSSKSTIIDFYNSPGGYVEKIFVATAQEGSTEKILGFASITQDLPSEVRKLGRGVYINWLAVDKDHLKQGIGFLLFSAVKKYAQKKMIKTISIRARFANTPAQRSYVRWTGDERPVRDCIGPIYTYRDNSLENMTSPDGTTNLDAMAFSDANVPDSYARITGYRKHQLPPTENNKTQRKSSNKGRNQKWLSSLNGGTLGWLWHHRYRFGTYAFLTLGSLLIGYKMWSKKPQQSRP